MATFTNFEAIEAWRMSRLLTKEIYALTNDGAFSKDFGLRDQIRRAAVSTMANIAEGFERGETGEFIHFLSMGKGSTGEVRSHLYVAFDHGYISKESFEHLSGLAKETGNLIAGLMNYLRHSKFKGTKYK